MIDAYASDLHYYQHLEPVWAALDRSERGTFYVSGQSVAHLAERSGHAAGWPRPAGGVPVLVAAYSDYQRCRRRPMVMMEHGVGQSYGTGPLTSAYVGGTGRERVVLFLNPNDHATVANRAAWPGVPSVTVGVPWLDAHAGRRVRDGRTVVFCGHWHNQGHRGAARSAWPHHWNHPAFRGQLATLADAGWTVVGSGHPRGRRKPPGFEQAWTRFGLPTVWDFADVLAVADVVVADNTSVAYLSAAVGVAQVPLDGPGYVDGYEAGWWPRFVVPPGVPLADPSRLAEAVMGATVPDVSQVVPHVGDATGRAVAAIRQHVLR